MCSVSPTAACRPSRTGASASRSRELVRKTGTSATPTTKRRKSRAQKRLLGAIREQRRQARAAGLRAVALTLTFDDNGAFCAGHISDFLERVRKALKRRGHALPYSWVLEREGRLHYHLMLWLPRDVMLDKQKLARWWPWGATWIASCKHVKRWGRYMAKFNCVARLPKATRLFGYGGLDESGRAAVQRAGLPRWLQALLPRGSRARRFAGGGWTDAETGELYVSPYLWTPWGWVTRPPGASGHRRADPIR
jgi:hypothetical protein